jgi:hypothetical protein
MPLSYWQATVGKKAQGKRTIHVKGGRSHTREIDAPGNPNDQPIVERMTRSRLDMMTPEQEEEWKTASVNAILSMTLRTTDQVSILNFLNKPPTSEAGPSDLSRHTHTSPLKKYGPKNWQPTTPVGLTPSKRDGPRTRPSSPGRPRPARSEPCTLTRRVLSPCMW